MVDISILYTSASNPGWHRRMAPPFISVVIPTVDGREDHYERCWRAYEDRTPELPLEIITVRNENSCGNAWQIGADAASGILLHFTADDLEPLEGWADLAIDAADNNVLPAPRLLNPDGSLYGAYPWGDPADGTPVDMSVVPFFRRDLWPEIGPMLPNHHYYTDNWVSWRAKRAGLKVAYLGSTYAFVHHWAQAKRGAGMSSEDRMRHDERLYREAIARVEAGDDL